MLKYTSYLESRKMTNHCLALPYLQGRTELGKRFAEENGGHTKEHDEFYRIADISRA
jgi:hypothetical protein